MEKRTPKMKRKLNDQWVEEIDGKKHMLKAVQSEHLCSGCAFSCTTFCRDPLMSERDIDCSQMIIIKDLGILNEDGLLPCPFCGEYPKIIYPTENMPVVSIVHTGGGHRVLLEFFINKQEAVDAWNRRA